jgi:osmotically-inducible protein OsmY
MRLSWLENIPPERVGLYGEYDHSGLAKRVKALLYQHFEQALADRLQVSQRGTVVILVGAIGNAQQADQLTQLALSQEGAEFVEIHDVSRRSSAA